MRKGQPGPRVPAIERFMAKIKVDEHGCWLWQGCVRGNGYGKFFTSHTARQPDVYAHRWSHEHFKGPIPEGLVVDHLCRVRLCVNPDHLEAVTQRENVLRGEAGRRTHCYRHHEFTPENTYTNPNTGRRVCRTCKSLHKRRSAA